ncbi:hypothetical protein FHS81_002153 [Pseudochelatococcus contaminans]|uniref:Tc1-like transposase DDE domain-containing protein n=1 Tax=Pseudochelatococcus contaminans TaxID=1538103 RepID=A0A7W6EHE5_9HYPH|nr:hypothetical protein [Pseudochelatococcus contaminans]
MQRKPERLVFIDETAVKTNLTRLRGRAPRGKRLQGTAPFGKWHTQIFIAALTGNALIAPWVIEGAMNGAAFDTYVEPNLRRNSPPALSSSSTISAPTIVRAQQKH